MKTVALIAIVAVALGAAEAGAVGRFRPAAPDLVILRVPARVTNDPIALLEQQHRNSPDDQQTVAHLAQAYVDRARSERELRYFGRAEVLLQPWLQRPDALPATLRVQADVLQSRHEFSAALRLLDRVIERVPRDAGARLMRASVLMVQGRATDARADCAAVIAVGEASTGTVCLAQILGATGRLAQAQVLLQTLLSRAGSVPFGVRPWALWLLADFADRRGDAREAEFSLRAALAAAPANEGVRVALADVLLARGASQEALRLVDVPLPSLGLLVRRARAQQLSGDSALTATRAQIAGLLELAARRGERPHLREEAMFALDIDRDADRALQLAEANFADQRETIDVRLLVRAAHARGDRTALDQAGQWLRSTGFEDHALGGLRT